MIMISTDIELKVMTNNVEALTLRLNRVKNYIAKKHSY